MWTITVNGNGPSYEVRVDEAGRGLSTHQVTADPGYCDELAGDVTIERLIVASFEFLLDREPKESILATFDLSVIERYFPEYRREVARYV